MHQASGRPPCPAPCEMEPPLLRGPPWEVGSISGASTKGHGPQPARALMLWWAEFRAVCWSVTQRAETTRCGVVLWCCLVVLSVGECGGRWARSLVVKQCAVARVVCSCCQSRVVVWSCLLMAAIAIGSLAVAITAISCVRIIGRVGQAIRAWVMTCVPGHPPKHHGAKSDRQGPAKHPPIHCFGGCPVRGEA